MLVLINIELPKMCKNFKFSDDSNLNLTSKYLTGI